MNKTVGVKFPYSLKAFEYFWGEDELAPRDLVVVESTQGIEIGEVVYIGKRIKDEETKTVIRKATEKDLGTQKELEEKAKELYPEFTEKVKKYGLKMDPVGVSLSLDDTKACFYFTAEGRVDFRELARDLSRSIQKQAILRQIGPRDHAKMIGGYGRCGRPVCCGSFLWGQEGVSMEKVEAQYGATKNTSKISGICGRLMCCLNYEEAEKSKKDKK